MAAGLADDLVSGGEWDEVRETFESDGVAIVDELSDGGSQIEKRSHYVWIIVQQDDSQCHNAHRWELSGQDRRG